MPYVIYGIRTCDTLKKARHWLEQHNIPCHFHDYRVSGVDAGLLRTWCLEQDWEKLLNRNGTTFRTLDETRKTGLDLEQAIVLMREQPAMIRRPVLDLGDRRLVGFRPEQYAAALLPR